MKKIWKYSITLCALLSIGVFASDVKFSWPIQTSALENKLTSLFGESRGDHFHNGVDISSDNEEIRPIDQGQIVFSRYDSDNPFRNGMGSGNCVWIGHSKGYLSGYFHLKDGREDGLLKKVQINRTDVIGRSGNTGHSMGSHLHFILAKDGGKKIINPLPLLPTIPDTSAPKIGMMILTNVDKFTYVNDGDNINVSRAFPVSIPILDSGIRPGQRRGIQRVKFILNGKVLKEAGFNEISLRDNTWVNETGQSFEELFFLGNYFVGNLSFVSGENILEVRTSDFSGNQAAKVIGFNVTRIK